MTGEDDSSIEDRHRDAAMHDALERDRVREGVTMALYVSLSLLAVMVALPPDAEAAAPTPALTVVATSVGLILAHMVAFRVSSRLVGRGQVSADSLALLGSQLAGGIAVTVVAVIPVLLIDGTDGVVTSELLLLGFIGLVAYVTARSARRSRTRAVVYVAGIVIVSLAVLWIKNLVEH